jgi:hypothetical protein
MGSGLGEQWTTVWCSERAAARMRMPELNVDEKLAVTSDTVTPAVPASV